MLVYQPKIKKKSYPKNDEATFRYQTNKAHRKRGKQSTHITMSTIHIQT